MSNRETSRCRVPATVPAALLAMLLALSATDGRADSTLLRGDVAQAAVTAHLDFRVVIPAVLVLDTRSGTMYSNDARSLAMLGTTQAAPTLVAGVTPGSAVLQMAAQSGNRGAWRGGSGMRTPPRGLSAGDVLCIP